MVEKMSGRQLSRRIIVVALITALLLGAFFASSAISSRVQAVNSAKDQVRSDLLEAVNAIETSAANSSQFLLVPAAADFGAEQQQALITATNTALVQVKNNRALDLIYLTSGKSLRVLNDGSFGKTSGYQLTVVGISDPVKNWAYTYNSVTQAYTESNLDPKLLASNAINADAAHMSVTRKEVSKVTLIAVDALGLLTPEEKISFSKSNLNGLSYARYLNQSGKLAKFDLPADTVKFTDAQQGRIELPTDLTWDLTFITTGAPQQSRVQLLAQTKESLSQETLRQLSSAQASIKTSGFSVSFDFPLGVQAISVRS